MCVCACVCHVCVGVYTSIHDHTTPKHTQIHKYRKHLLIIHTPLHIQPTTHLQILASMGLMGVPTRMAQARCMAGTPPSTSARTMRGMSGLRLYVCWSELLGCVGEWVRNFVGTQNTRTHTHLYTPPPSKSPTHAPGVVTLLHRRLRLLEPRFELRLGHLLPARLCVRWM